MIDIEIDGKPLRVAPGSMIIEVADKAGISIPRFCYHKKLSVAANCRMCLVEVEKAPKPLPACATPVTAGMKVYTQSAKACDAQKSVMEFLLINHPLDCPICDQGGECELQDLSLGYGKDVSRFNVGKRAVVDDDLGPLIETEMTRCIHCTRCVRFGQEIAGLRELGATGRGENMQIGTYIKHSLESELSGNIIDLCPVGALTSKPFRFTARAWELRQAAAIAPHDCIGSNIYVHTRRQEVMRVVPRENEALNETWISDRDRFSYLAINSEERLQKPLIKQNGEWFETDWSTALATAATGIKKVIKAHGSQQLAALASASSTTEELFLLQKLMRSMGCHSIDHRLHQTDFSDQNHFSLYPGLEISVQELENQDAILLIGSNIQREQPIAAHRIRKATLRGAQVLSVNLIDHPVNFAQAECIITTPMLFTTVLAEKVDQFVDVLKKSGKAIILLGALAHNHPEAAAIRALAQRIAQLSGAKMGYLTEGANSAGAWLAGAIPHREAAGKITAEKGLAANAMWDACLRAYLLLGIEPVLDCANSAAVSKALQEAEFIVALSAFRSADLMQYADVILPIGTFAETEGTFVNVEGRWQSFNAIVPAPGETKPGWKVLRVLANQLELANFNYVSAEQVREELQQLLTVIPAPVRTEFSVPSIKTTHHNALMSITEWPLYAVDSVVRRSSALQQSATNEPVAIYINTALANKLKLQKEMWVTVAQGEAKAQLPIVISDRIPDNCVWIPAGRWETVGLGPVFGEVEISPSPALTGTLSRGGERVTNDPSPLTAERWGEGD